MSARAKSAGGWSVALLAVLVVSLVPVLWIVMLGLIVVLWAGASLGDLGPPQ